MTNTAKKLNRAGRSHSGNIRIPYSLMRSTTTRNGRERKLSASLLTATAAIFSFSEGDKIADFTCRELSERYNLSKSSAERAIKAALDAKIVKRLNKISQYKFEGEKGEDGFLLIEEWAYFAEFEFGSRRGNLSQNDVRVLFYILSLCRSQKGAPIWRASYSHIARRLNLSKNTVIAAVDELKAAKLIYTSGRSWNGHTKMTFSVNEKALSAAKSETIRRAKTISTEIQSANARTDRDRYYAHLQAIAEAPAEKARTRARSDEAYRTAEQELRELDLEIARAEYQGKADIRALLLDRQRAAQERRRERLEAMGLTDDDLRPRYNCVKCSDKGYLPNGAACDCYPTRRGRP